MEIAFSMSDLFPYMHDHEKVPIAKWRALPSTRLCDVAHWIARFAPDTIKGIGAAERIALFAARRAVSHFDGMDVAPRLRAFLDAAEVVQATPIGSPERRGFRGWEDDASVVSRHAAHLSRAIADAIVVDIDREHNARDIEAAMYVICYGFSEGYIRDVNAEIDRVLGA